MDPDTNHFSLFNLPISYALDAMALDQAFHKLQITAHPDQQSPASASDNDPPVLSMLANKAYKILKNPMTRAQHILEIHGISLEMREVPQAILFASLEWREQLLEVTDDLQSIEAMLQALTIRMEDSYTRLASCFAAMHLENAADTYVELRFLYRFKNELINKMDQFDEVI